MPAQSAQAARIGVPEGAGAAVRPGWLPTPWWPQSRRPRSLARAGGEGTRATCEGVEHGRGPQQVIPLLPEGQQRARGPHDDEAQAEDGDGGGRDAVFCGTGAGAAPRLSGGLSAAGRLVRRVLVPMALGSHGPETKPQGPRRNPKLRVTQRGQQAPFPLPGWG